MYNVKGDDHLFAHAFLTMECNLMAIICNCVHMHVQHIQWRSDSLIYHFGTLKGKQTGDRANYPWHVYSNPNNPTMCPVLAMSKYFFSHPDILATNSKLFPGNHQYEIFLRLSTESFTTILKNPSPLELRKEQLDPTLSVKEESQ